MHICTDIKLPKLEGQPRDGHYGIKHSLVARGQIHLISYAFCIHLISHALHIKRQRIPALGLRCSSRERSPVLFKEEVCSLTAAETLPANTQIRILLGSIIIIQLKNRLEKANKQKKKKGQKYPKA